MGQQLLYTYLEIIKRLDIDARLQLIAGISASIREEKPDREKRLLACFGRLDTDQTAEELIQEIRAARYFRDKSFDL